MEVDWKINRHRYTLFHSQIHINTILLNIDSFITKATKRRGLVRSILIKMCKISTMKLLKLPFHRTDGRPMSLFSLV
jgi:hypothetical protein